MEAPAAQQDTTWRVYVHEHLLRPGSHHTAGAVIGPGSFTWSQSATFPTVQNNDYNSVIEEFDHPGSLVNGLSFGGTMYMNIQHLGPNMIRATIDALIYVWNIQHWNCHIQNGCPPSCWVFEEKPDESSQIIAYLGNHVINNA
ncbi:profilin-4-like [Argentina anserina]|uniref:profilin-4-like n=1 Tax=Argentina anserina TaxID=57926 RepID=UPI0021763AE4|nr:profilin-4-like [Potentilla anserina]